MNLANLVGQPRVKQHPLGGGRFTSVDMRTNTDISVTLYRCLAGHGMSPEREKRG
jgi:hypothetical protein